MKKRDFLHRLTGSRARIAGGGAGTLILCMLGAVTWIAWPLPPELAEPGPIPSLTVLDRDGLLLRTTRAPDGTRGGWIPLADIDPDIIRAFMAMEDERFYEHSGVDLRAVARAARDNLLLRRIVSGASTITMQTARLLRPLPRTWGGKVRQALWALRLEAHLDKSEILETYLNRIPLGQGTRGVAAAAALYFDASASDLSLGQAATLAALAHAPSRDNPFVSRGRSAERRSLVLSRLATVGYTSAEEIERTSHEPLHSRRRSGAFRAPHFTTYWLSTWDPGAGSHHTWRTSLDLGLQVELEAEVRHTVNVFSDERVQHAAAVVLRVRTGEILAWVGSPDFWADTAGQVDMVVSRRQPGSALKPFLYGLAFDRGYAPASVLPDIPRTYSTQLGTYSPRNYDRRFRGPVRAREALASSYNVPAVELANRLGAGSFLSTLQAAGFVSLDQDATHYGVGLALGNGDVTLLELANAYRALANGGVWRPYRWLAVDEDEAALASSAGRRVVSEMSAVLVLDILADPVARIPSFGTNTPFDFPFPVAAKTGTSRRFTDNWAIGTTGEFTVAVWVGNFSGRPMAGVSGITGAGPLLQRAVLATARRYDPGDLTTVEEVDAIPAVICRLSGKLATPFCPHMVEWFASDAQETEECDWHHDGRITLPELYAEWADVHSEEARAIRHTVASHASGAGETLLAFADPVRGAPAQSGFRIISPLDGDHYEVPPGVDARFATVALRAVGGEQAQRIRWYVDGEETASPRWRLRPGAHTIRAESGDGEADEVRIVVR